MKRFISMLALCSLALLLLTSCMSDEEKQQARENEKIAKPLIESYVDENYKGALITDVECMTNQGGSIFPATYATDCVKAKVLHFTKRFDVILNLETGRFYNNYNKTKFTDGLESLLFEKISVEAPRDVEIKFISRDLISVIDTEGWGFLDDDTFDAQDLLKSGEYKMLAVCKYANSDMDFETIPIKPFFKNEYKSAIEIAFVNYRSDARYDGSNLYDYEFTVNSLDVGQDAFFDISEIKTATLSYGIETDLYDEQTSDIPSHNYKEEYKHYESQVFNGIEFIWDDEYYDLEFSTVKADPVVVAEALSSMEDETFYATSNNAVKVKATRLTDEEPYDNTDVYIYRNLDSLGQYMIVEKDNYLNASELTEYRGMYVYQEKDLHGSVCEFTLGFYEIADN